MDVNAQTKKPFIKQFWWLGFIFVLGLGVFIAIAYSGWKHDKELQKEKDSQPNGTTQLGGEDPMKANALASDFPTCPSDASGLFTKPFMDNDNLAYIVPLGNSNQSGHVDRKSTR